jgi:hypothetical protein
MRKNKPITKEQPKAFISECPYYDPDVANECFAPWDNGTCEGSKHKCGKLKLHWLASLSDKKREEWIKEHQE